MKTNASQNEGVRVLEEIVCRAIPEQSEMAKKKAAKKSAKSNGRKKSAKKK